MRVRLIRLLNQNWELRKREFILETRAGIEIEKLKNLFRLLQSKVSYVHTYLQDFSQLFHST